MTFKLDNSTRAFREAQKYMPGGVNSPVRSYRAVGGSPPFIAGARGSRIFDIDGHEYIDYVGSWGPLILGHAHPAVVDALQAAVTKGTSYGAPTELETELACLITRALPAVEMVRMVNSGTEATMSAMRLARAVTGRDQIVKFAGCYHGHHDSLLVKAGSGAATFGVPDSPGVPAAIAGCTITVPYNDEAALAELFRRQGETIAAVIIEPVPGNMGLVLPQAGYLAKVREITARYGVVLIFDEVMSGFRTAYGGAQVVYNIKPDLTCLAKVIGGGLPVGAYGGRRDMMAMVSPAGPVYQAGTLSGNPLAMTAGLTTLKILTEQPDLYRQLAARTERLGAGFKAAAEKYAVPVTVHTSGSMFCLFFTAPEVYNYAEAKQADTEAFRVFFQAMLEQGIYLGPSQFETGFVSAAHSEADITRTIAAGDRALAKVAAYRSAGRR